MQPGQMCMGWNPKHLWTEATSSVVLFVQSLVKLSRGKEKKQNALRKKDQKIMQSKFYDLK